jgi:hypothetical protein
MTIVEQRMSRRLVLICAIVLLLLGTAAVPASLAFQAGDRGVILSLTGIGAARPGDSIVVNARVQALRRINRSNLYYVVSAPSGAMVAQHTTSLGLLRRGDTYSDSWSTANTPETGTYTVTLCWSTGTAHSCNIASASSSFYSVPTLGWALSAAALGLLGLFLWRRRGDFGRQPR